ncbi:MAG: hypothetical protein LUQ40_00490 [Methanomicrobiales archaeon]|nr:hypothetical protein [Methanomicrobiales archaeon]
MQDDTDQDTPVFDFTVTEEVREYIRSRPCDQRLCTSCGGAVLLPVTLKPPKPSDFQIVLNDRTLYISRFQARYIRTIHAGMIPRFYRHR